MSKHTPGPWEWRERRHGRGFRRFIYAPGESSPITVIESRDREVSVNEANAHLIAAAPDLLAACEEARDALRFIRDSGPGLIAQHGDALDTVLSAIAKALNESVRHDGGKDS